MIGRDAVGILLAIAALAAVITGLGVIGSPGEARARRLDQHRVADLTRLEREVKAFRTRRETLPATLDELASEGGLGLERTDPDTRTPYEYRLIGATRYELCATFATADSTSSAWAHGRGRQCFAVDVKR